MPAHTLNVPDDSAGQRLDRFLASVLGTHSRSQIQRLIEDGRVHVAGRAAKSNQAVKAGQVVVIDVPEPSRASLEPEALPLTIVY